MKLETLNYNHQTKLESYINNKLEIFGEKLLNELAVNNKRLEKKVEKCSTTTPQDMCKYSC